MITSMYSKIIPDVFHEGVIPANISKNPSNIFRARNLEACYPLEVLKTLKKQIAKMFGCDGFSLVLTSSKLNGVPPKNVYDPSEFYLKRAVGLKDGNKEMSQKQKEDLQEYREVQNESKDSYQVDPENIIGWDMLSDSWVHENIPIIFGKKKHTKFTTSIDWSSKLISFIVLPHR